MQFSDSDSEISDLPDHNNKQSLHKLLQQRKQSEQLFKIETSIKIQNAARHHLIICAINTPKNKWLPERQQPCRKDIRFLEKQLEVTMFLHESNMDLIEPLMPQQSQNNDIDFEEQSLEPFNLQELDGDVPEARMNSESKQRVYANNAQPVIGSNNILSQKQAPKSPEQQEQEQVLDNQKIIQLNWQLTKNRDKILSEIGSCLNIFALTNQSQILKSFILAQQNYEQQFINNNSHKYHYSKEQLQLGGRRKFLVQLNQLFIHLLQAKSKDSIIQNLKGFFGGILNFQEVIDGEVYNQEQVLMQEQGSSSLLQLSGGDGGNREQQNQEGYQQNPSNNGQEYKEAQIDHHYKEVSQQRNVNLSRISEVKDLIKKSLPRQAGEILMSLNQQQLLYHLGQVLKQMETSGIQPKLRNRQNEEISNDPLQQKNGGDQNEIEDQIDKVRMLNSGEVIRLKPSDEKMHTFFDIKDSLSTLIEALQQKMKKDQ